MMNYLKWISLSSSSLSLSLLLLLWHFGIWSFFYNLLNDDNGDDDDYNNQKKKKEFQGGSKLYRCVCVCVIECIVWIFMNFRHYSSICHFLYHFCLLLLAKRIIILFFSLMNFSCFFFHSSSFNWFDSIYIYLFIILLLFPQFMFVNCAYRIYVKKMKSSNHI